MARNAGIPLVGQLPIYPSTIHPDIVLRAYGDSGNKVTVAPILNSWAATHYTELYRNGLPKEHLGISPVLYDLKDLAHATYR